MLTLHRIINRLFLMLTLATPFTGIAPAAALEAGSPDAALAALLKDTRAAFPGACTQPNADRLTGVLCAKRIRIGVRETYPLFAMDAGEKRQGYEIDVARAIAGKLGVSVEFVKVVPASRIPLLAENRIDLAIATMGHNTQRDGQARFIRPHYYQSETTLIGPQGIALSGWKDIPGRTVCVTVGNGSNAELISHGARLMLFDEASALPERLKDQTCTLAAQDDSFFAASFTDAAFAARFAPKFGFAQVPWGMAVARNGSENLARALEFVSQTFHRDGTFLDIARTHRISTGFLEKQNADWQRPSCNTEGGSKDAACVLPPLNNELQPTRYAKEVTAFEKWFASYTGIELTLPMLKTAPAWSMFKDGMVNSLILIGGALAATLAFAVLFGAALGSRSPLLHWPVHALTVILQSSPVVLTLVIAAAIAHAAFPYSGTLALGAAIVALGLSNGSNAAHAVAEAMASLRAEQRSQATAMPEREIFVHALGRSATQIVAFLVNAAKGTPVASFIGAPELLSALTDITSFSSGRVTTYWLLLIFYIAVVMMVIWLCGKLRAWLERKYA